MSEVPHQPVSGAGPFVVDSKILSESVGPSTHVARDKWTLDDSLGYFPYAYAIFRFLTDQETEPPLAISMRLLGGWEDVAHEDDPIPA